MIISQPTTDDYRDGWDKVFGHKDGPTYAGECVCGEPAELPNDLDPLCDTCRDLYERALAND